MDDLPARMGIGDATADDANCTEALTRQRALRAAVLIDAIRCVLGAGAKRERQTRRAALRWVTSRDTMAPFSFTNVCEALGLEPSRIRRLLLAPTLGPDGAGRLALRPDPNPASSRNGSMRRPRRDRRRYVVVVGGK